MKKRSKISVFVLTIALAAFMMPAFANAQMIANDTYYLVNRNSGQLLTVSGAATWDGAKIVQDWASGNQYHQRWTITYRGTDGGGEYYRIINSNSLKALDVPSSSHTAGLQMQQYTWNLSNAQLWYVRANSDGSYSWINRGSGLTLDVNQASMAPGEKVIQWYFNGSYNQRWNLKL